MINHIKNLNRKQIIAILLILLIAGAAAFIYKKRSSVDYFDTADTVNIKTVEEQLIDQDSIEKVEVSPEVENDNQSKLAAINFYKNLTQNSKDSITLANYLQKRGTANLIKQFNSNVKPGFNPLICGVKGAPTSASLIGNTEFGGKKVYALRLMDRGKPMIELQVIVVNQNNAYLVDSIACPGPV